MRPYYLQNIRKDKCKFIPEWLKAGIYHAFCQDINALKRKNATKIRKLARYSFSLASLEKDLSEFRTKHSGSINGSILPIITEKELYQAYGNRPTKNISLAMRDLLCNYAFGSNWDIAIKVGEREIESKDYYEPVKIKQKGTEQTKPTTIPKRPTAETNSFLLLDNQFWTERMHVGISPAERKSYLLEINASAQLVPKIVAHGYYVPFADYLYIQQGKFRIKQNIRHILQAEGVRILKISAGMGAGKTTFGWHLAKLCKDSHEVLYKKPPSSDNEIIIVPKIQVGKPVLVIIDNCSKFELFELVSSLKDHFVLHDLTICLIDQDFYFNYIEDWNEISQECDVVEARLATGREFYREAFDLFNSYAGENKQFIPSAKYDSLNAEFIGVRDDLTLVDRLSRLKKQLSHIPENKYRGYDWKIWDKVTADKSMALQDLFCIVATYYQFGRSVPLGVFDLVDQKKIVKILSPEGHNESLHYPIILENNQLFLRHESVARQYFSETVHRNLSIALFGEFLKNNNRKDYIYLLRNVYWIIPFRKSFIFGSFENKESFFELCRIRFLLYSGSLSIADDKELLKTKTELAKLYFELGKKNESIKLLEEIVEANRESDVHARTFLLGLYAVGDLEQGEKGLLTLKEGLNVSPDNAWLLSNSPALIARIASADDNFSAAKEIMNLYRRQLVSAESANRLIRRTLLYFFRNDYTENTSCVRKIISELIKENIRLTIHAVIVVFEILIKRDDIDIGEFFEEMILLFEHDENIDNKEQMIESWASTFANAGKDKLAVKLLLGSRVAFPKFATTNTVLADHYYSQKKYAECVTLLVKYPEEMLHQTHAIPLIKSLFRLGEIEKGEYYLQISFRRQTDQAHIKGFLSLGVLLWFHNYYRQCQEIITHCQSINPYVPDLILFKTFTELKEQIITRDWILAATIFLDKTERLDFNHDYLTDALERMGSKVRDVRIRADLVQMIGLINRKQKKHF